MSSMFCNQDNKNFYELSPQNYINSFLVKEAGLDKDSDLNIILGHININENNSLLDLGAGEGRVLDYFKETLEGNFSGVEYTKSKFLFLKERYKNNKKISIYYNDALSFTKQHDYTILSFSFLLEFNLTEQQRLFKHLIKITHKKIFIDLPVYKSKKNGVFINNRIAIIENDWGKTQGYYPKLKELVGYFDQTDFDIYRIHRYKTETNRKRVLYVFKKKERKKVK